MAQTTVNFNLKTAGFANYANQTLTFRLLTAGADKTDDTVTLAGVVTATSAANGTGSVALFTNGDSDINSIFEVIFPNREKAKFLIPAGTSSIHLSDLLVDHVPGGSDTQQSSVYAEAIKRANHTGTQLLNTISDAGTIASQASNSVSISGGSISGVTLTASTANLTDATDKRFMTDAQETKLDTVGTDANETTTARVQAAGALMDSECAGGDPTNVKALNQSLVSGAAPNFATTNMTDASNKRFMTDAQESKLDGIAAGATGNLTNNEIRDAVEAADDSNTFTNADHDKLNGIDTSADVTDATTVAAAGALMESALTSTANVKALNQSVVAGASPNFVTTNMTDASNKRLMTDAQETTLDSLVLTAGSVTTINAFARDSLLNSNATSIRSALSIPDTGAIAGFVPKSITFPTTSDFLSIANDADLNVGTGDFTLSFWARLDGTGTEPILNKYSGAGYSLKFSSGSLILTIQGTGDPLAVTLATGLNDNKWHVYVVTVDRDGNAVAYVDNIAQTARDVSTVQSSLDNTTAFRIGYDGANASSEIAFGNYVALHKSALTAPQAAQIYFSADAALTAVVPTLMVDLREVTETFTDVSASPLSIVTNGTVRFNQDRLTEFTGTNVLATSTLGYTTGSGGTVTQASNKTTAVTLNKINGEIVMNAAALADDATAAFTLTNSTIAATDVVIVNVASVGTAGAYQVTVGAVAAGSCSISVLNVSGGSLSQAIKLNFAVIKAVAS